MTLREILTLFFAWCIGLGIGAFFFGGLWWTVRKTVQSARPALWLLSSLLLRMSIALAGFYFIVTNGLFAVGLAEGHWQPLLPYLLGFIMARMLTTQLTRPAAAKKMEPRHAP